MEASRIQDPGGPPDAVGEAPARVNLIGEHTDYAEGLVLPLPVPLWTRVELRRRKDREVRARTDLGGGDRGSYRLGEERPGRGWLDYLQGVTRSLARAGAAVRGAGLTVRSEIPAGSGLASSAALTVAAVRAFDEAFALGLSSLEVARLARAAETDFVGAPVGWMDPLAASLGCPGEALFVDVRTLAAEPLALPAALEVGVLHSGIAHRNAGGTYADRRREADAAARELGVPALRDISPGDEERIARLPPPLDRRARHVATENARVRAFVAALRAGDIAALGPLLAASHASLRDDYQVSHPDVDTLVALAGQDPDVLGARMTGGGCGGAVLLLCPSGRALAAGDRIIEAYRARTGRPGDVLLPRPPAALAAPRLG
ncbi:MAG TPA: galactokinase family protein [Myxococcaceae bacterium]|nr:galactokinase family protein [Myxococcaceae bacterium]